MANSDGRADVSSPPGLLQSLKAYFGTWVELFRTRLDLFSTELEEERERIRQIIILGAAAWLCVVVGLLLVTCFVVVLFWETNYRLAVLAGFALLYLAVGGILGAVTRHKSRTKPKLFSASLGELAKDYRRLSS